MQPAVAVDLVNWGDVPSWIGACATVLGLAAAIVAAVFVKGQLDAMKAQLRMAEEQAGVDRAELERQRSEQEASERLRARTQAEQVDVIPGSAPATLPGINPGTFLTLTIKNDSNRPIRGVRCKANLDGGALPMYDMDQHLGHLTSDLDFLAMTGAVERIGPPPLTFEPDGTLRSPLPLLRRGDEVTFLLARPADRHPAVRFWAQFEDDARSLWELDSDMHLAPIEARWE